MPRDHRPWVLLLTCVILILRPLAAGADREPSSRLLEVAPGESLRVTMAGTGEPIVLIPGLFGSAYGFRKILPRMAESGWHTIVIEPLGVGESGRPPEADYSLTAQADRVAAALERLGIERAIVVAHSVGASIAYRLASRHPARVAALVSLEGGVAESAATPGFRRALKFAPLLKLFGKGFVRGKIRGQLAAGSASPAWITDEVLDGYTRGPLADLGATLRAFQRMAKSKEPEPLAPKLAELRCPLRLVLGGAVHEGGPSAADVELLRKSVASFAIERAPDAGHYVFEEAPDAVLAAIGRTVEEVGAARSAERSAAE